MVAQAQGNADRFSALVEEYEDAPEVTRTRLWLETLEEVLSGNRKVIGGDSRQLIYVPMPDAGGNRGASGSNSPPPLLTPDALAPTVTSNPDDASTLRDGREPRSGREEVNR